MDMDLTDHLLLNMDLDLVGSRLDPRLQVRPGL